MPLIRREGVSMNIDVKRHSVRFVAVLFFLATAWIQAQDLPDFATGYHGK